MWKCFMLQARVVRALMLREIITRYGRDNLGFLWVIGEPALFCVGVSIMWTLIRPAHEHGVPMTAFVITGYVPLTMWRHCIGRSVKAFESNGALMFHRQVTPFSMIVARSLLEIIGTITAGAIVAIAAILMGFMEPPYDMGMIYLGLLFMSIFSFATCLILASLSERSEVLEKFIGVFSYLSLPFSGAFAMVEWIPKSYQWLVLWSPSVHALEMIREGQFGPVIHPYYSLTFISAACVSLLVIGMSLTLRVRKYIVIH